MPDSPYLPLSGYAALITGGSRGIGAATALELAGLGAHVQLTYRESNREAERVGAACAATAGSAEVFHADFESHTGIGELVKAVRSTGRDVDIVVSNASMPIPRALVTELDTELFVGKVADDLRILHRLIRAFAPGMRERGFGRIVAVTSTHAVGPTQPCTTALGVAKAAVETLVRYAAAEVGDRGVTINAVRPSFVETDATAGVPDRVRDLLRQLTPAGRLAGPADIAKVVSLVVQPAGGWINGAVVPATGGLQFPVDWQRISP